jgi:hypothetical protein
VTVPSHFMNMMKGLDLLQLKSVQRFVSHGHDLWCAITMAKDSKRHCYCNPRRGIQSSATPEKKAKRKAEQAARRKNRK